MELKRYPNPMPPAVAERGGNKEREKGRKEEEKGRRGMEGRKRKGKMCINKSFQKSALMYRGNVTTSYSFSLRLQSLKCNITIPIPGAATYSRQGPITDVLDLT